MEEVRDNLRNIDLATENVVDAESIETLMITPEELIFTINSFQQKAPGLDGITKIHLTKAIECIKQPLTSCFNAALSCGYFPSLYKQTKLIFVPKPGKDATNVANYRLISLLNTTGKLEKLLNRRLTSHLQEHDLFNRYQNGFRSHRGTETALAIIWEAIGQGRKKKLKVCLTSRDIEKAFDRVWQEGLKYKLAQLNLHPKLLKITAQYLDYRTARIQIEDHRGVQFPIEYGVPQGGCLSTTLFSIYTSDIPDKIYPWTHNTYYADDVTQIVRGTLYSEIKQVWSAETNNINNYEHQWLIKTNMRKFQLLDFGSKTERTFQHQCFGLNCTTAKEAKILGLTLTPNGMKKHIGNNINKAKVQLQKLQKLRNLSERNRRKLYLMLVKPQLLYPCIPLHVTSNAQMMNLQKIQNKGINFILGRGRYRGETTEARHRLTNLDPINITLHSRAQNIWRTISDNVNGDILDELRPTIREDTMQRTLQNFPSSLEKKDATAVPFYTQTDGRWQN